MKKRRKPVPPGSPEEWLNHAASDLALANLAFQSDEILPEQICFHAQQAVEKSLKCVLLHHGIHFPLVHDIEELINIARKNRINLPGVAEDMTDLTPYAVESRYPGYCEDFDESEVKKAISIARSTVEWAKSFL